ncbi:hypothetical protein [Mangrovimonas futianensis]|uniref:hypothetical protein n=1 Tax=Mangrovimonas futianensis TaxID=2895523 RepID=UPI001E4D0845|nr:hypothetical protein [Mangrovimonas futianensis]MCF1423149.1 hypothetical protein [Mangrovimonas futianensis]
MFKRISSAKTNFISILIHIIGALTLYAIAVIIIFFLFYFFLDKGFGSFENRANRLAINLIFYFPLIAVSFLFTVRIIRKAKKGQFELSKTTLIALIISVVFYLYFWLH